MTEVSSRCGRLFGDDVASGCFPDRGAEAAARKGEVVEATTGAACKCRLGSGIVTVLCAMALVGATSADSKGDAPGAEGRDDGSAGADSSVGVASRICGPGRPQDPGLGLDVAQECERISPLGEH